jgi:hypothetical protein
MEGERARRIAEIPATTIDKIVTELNLAGPTSPKPM